MLKQIDCYDAQAKNKKEFIDKVQKRIEDIWSAEDGEVFDNIYMETDLLDRHSVEKAIAYIEEKGRTKSAQQYLNALRSCSKKNLTIAHFYQANKLFVEIAVVLGFLLICVAIIFGKRIGLIGWSRWFSIGVGIVIIILYRWIVIKWKTLTIEGKAVHNLVKNGIYVYRVAK